MQAQRIEVRQDRVTTGESQDARRVRLEINPTSGFDRAGGRHDLSALNPNKDASKPVLSSQPRFIEHRFRDGTTVQVPMLSESDAAKIDEILRRRSPEEQAELTRRAAYAGKMAFLEAAENPGCIASGNYSVAMTSSVQQTYEQYILGPASNAAAQAQQDYIYIGLHGVETQLQDFFGGMQERQGMANDNRAQVNELNEMLADWPDGQSQTFTWTEIVMEKDQPPRAVEHTEQLSKDEARALVEKLQGQIDSLGSITQTDQMRLQKMIQDYQQTVTIISNTMKVQDEMMRSVIQNVRA